MSIVSFIKMHGCGNDFAIIMKQDLPETFTHQQIKFLADRHKGIGFDQLIIIDDSSQADCFMHIYNADGSYVEACGNASRCVARLISQKKAISTVIIETMAGILKAEMQENGLVKLTMGMAKFDWQQIPLAQMEDTNNIDLKIGRLPAGIAVNIGNPHIVFFTSNIDQINLSEIGPQIENHPLFPQKINVNIAEVVSGDVLKLRVWERGAGETLACGTGASATMVAAHKKGLVGNKATVCLKGGDLMIELQEDKQVIMSGEAVFVFTGQINL